MDYRITPLSDQLIHICWYHSPKSSDVERQFVQDLKDLLDASPHPIYFCSDLRRGHITNVYTLRKLGELTSHPHWGGGTAYGLRLSTDLFVNTFERMAVQKKGDRMFYKQEDAIRYLESQCEGLTTGIDFSQVEDIVAN